MEILWLIAIIIICVIGWKAVHNSTQMKGAANEIALAATNPQIVSAFQTVENITPSDEILEAICPSLFTNVTNMNMTLADLKLYPDLLRDVKFLYFSRLYREHGSSTAIRLYQDSGGRDVRSEETSN